jgi:aminoglycoside phosphotransferase family enzyme
MTGGRPPAPPSGLSPRAGAEARAHASPTRSGNGASPTLAEKVAALRQSDAYPEATTDVVPIETHMSWVFLTDRHAYKMKKPVRHAFLDFSTLALRRADCDEEIRLNRRLAPDVYLDVVALVVDEDGALRVAAGEPVEWLVRMVRLPRERMLDVAMERGEASSDDLARVAAVLASFYRRCERVDLAPEAYAVRLRTEVERCRDDLLATEADFDGGVVGVTAAKLLDFLDRRRGLLDERVRGRRVVEGHGDLRPEHVCLLPAPVVIDCLEFNRDLRIADAADELRHLEMECTRLGFEAIGRTLVGAISGALGDAVPAPLAAFYRAARAFTRARLAAWHNVDAPAADPRKWIRRAHEYLVLAELFSRGCAD